MSRNILAGEYSVVLMQPPFTPSPSTRSVSLFTQSLELPPPTLVTQHNTIFTQGGRSKSHPHPIPILIRSGDVIVMAKESRYCYHGVPAILPHHLLLTPGHRRCEDCCDVCRASSSAASSSASSSPYSPSYATTTLPQPPTSATPPIPTLSCSSGGNNVEPPPAILPQQQQLQQAQSQQQQQQQQPIHLSSQDSSSHHIYPHVEEYFLHGRLVTHPLNLPPTHPIIYPPTHHIDLTRLTPS